MINHTTDQTSQGSRDEIEERATDFLLRRRFWDWTSQDEAALELWLEESASHRVVYLRLQSLAARNERLAALRRPPSQAKGVQSARTGPLRRFMFPLVASAASLALIATLSVAVFDYLMRPDDRSFETHIGGRATLKFADGTQVELNTDSAIRYRMTTQERLVWLDHGEAYFQVAHDVLHPFIVVVGRHRITDLGTQFLVRSDAGNNVEVALVQGRAQLSSDDGRAGSTILTPGDDAIATDAAFSISRISPEEIADELAWQRGVIIFRDTPLADAVQQLNRYNQTKLQIDDSRVAALRIGGEFRTNDIEEFLQLAQLALKVRVERRGAEILLTSGDGRTPAARRNTHWL